MRVRSRFFSASLRKLKTFHRQPVGRALHPSIHPSPNREKWNWRKVSENKIYGASRSLKKKCKATWRRFVVNGQKCCKQSSFYLNLKSASNHKSSHNFLECFSDSALGTWSRMKLRENLWHFKSTFNRLMVNEDEDDATCVSRFNEISGRRSTFFSFKAEQFAARFTFEFQSHICARQITIIVPSLDFKGLFSSNLGTRVNINQSDWGFWASFSHGMENGVPRQHIAWLSTYDNFLSTHTKFHITKTRVFRFIKIIAFVRATQSFLLSWNFIDLISGRKYGIVW